MLKSVTTWVAMSAANSAGAPEPVIHSLGGIGLFVAERDTRGHWRFRRHAHAVLIDSPGDTMLEALGDRLPADATLIGWNVDSVLVPKLLAATATASPTVAHYFAARLHRLLRGGVVDMALCHGGMGAAAIGAVARQLAIEPSLLDADVTALAWANADIPQIQVALADEALVLWRMFLQAAGDAAADANAATDAWLELRARIRPVTASNDVERT